MNVQPFAFPWTVTIPAGMWNPFKDRLVPIGAGADQHVELGMTLRDYFIAHAPAEPQDWFVPVMARECPVVPSMIGLDDMQREAIDRLDYSDDHPLADWAREWVAKRSAATTAQEQWQAEFRKELLLQWPGAWADEQLKRRAR